MSSVSPVTQHVELRLSLGTSQFGQSGLRELGQRLERHLVPLAAHVDNGSLRLTLGQTADSVKIVVSVQRFEQIDPGILQVRVKIESILPYIISQCAFVMLVGAAQLFEDIGDSSGNLWTVPVMDLLQVRLSRAIGVAL